MSYVALYRKLRPKRFEDVVGQDHIVRTLKNQISNNRISHAYLFCGTRGTGKTSMAKIFAQAINCMETVDGEACGNCKICLEIENQRSMNVIEIDAASNNGVDNIRDIREEVMYQPPEGNYKVYIIDEVHMLSAGAFNALLKTLEEPPAHVVFILATTDPQKVPATILSRCQRFDFKRILPSDMSATLKKYMDNDNIKITDDAVNYICRLSDGAMRDALSILDQTIAFYFNEEITIDKVQEIIGSVDSNIFQDFTGALLSYDSNKSISIVNEIIINGRDISQFTQELISHFRNLLVAKSLDNLLDVKDMSIDNFDALKKSSETIERDILIYYITEFSNLLNGLKYDKNPRISFEVLCIKLCNPETLSKSEALLSRIDKLEKTIENGSFATVTSSEKVGAPKEEKKIKLTKAIPDDIKNVIKTFDKFIKADSNASRKSFLQRSYPAYLDGNTLYLVGKSKGVADYLGSKTDEIKSELESYYEKEFIVVCISEEDYDNKHKEVYGVKDTEKPLFDFSDIISKIDCEVKEI